MLNCESCSYIKSIQTNNKEKNVHICEFTGFIFQEKIEDYEMEYHPCYDYDYKTYEQEQEKLKQEQQRPAKIA